MAEDETKTEPTTETYVREFLTGYAWMGTREEQAREIKCIMAQKGWEVVDARADQYAGAQWESGPDAYAEGQEWALSALYECHDGPHLDDCPRNH